MEIVKSKIFKKLLLIILSAFLLMPIFTYLVFIFTLNPQQRNDPTLVLSFVLIFLFAIILGFFIAAIVSLFISKRLLLLKEKAQKMIQLDFNDDIDIKNKDEIGDLEFLLNDLSHSLSNSFNLIDAKNQELIEKIENEKKLEEERLEFIAATSHELKTPIAVLRGQTEGMIYGVGKFKDRESYLKKNLVILDNMNNLVMEMIDVNRLSTTKELKIEEINLSNLLKEQIDRIMILIEEKKQKVDIDLEEQVIIYGDKKFLDRAINNLLINANKYSPESESINVKLFNENEFIICRIENTGVNIPDNEINNLFNQFTRIEKSGNKNTGGSGIGLYVVKKIMDIHKFDFQLYNSNNGVEFAFKIEKNRKI